MMLAHVWAMAVVLPSCHARLHCQSFHALSIEL